MATRNFVPRSGSEGQIGTLTKPWGKVVTDTLIGSVSGSMTSTGSFGHLVVMGNITASGTVRADAFESVTGGETISFKDSLHITGNITASLNISASGDIRSDGRIFEKGTSVIDHATAMAIVFGG
mgnify:FL=1|tara:strand:+ start:113 stop:487 length:375 start_codon:yes stop_codon:yes gene_type:complete